MSVATQPMPKPPAAKIHDMLADASHDEVAAENFVVDLKAFLQQQVEPVIAARLTEEVVPALEREGAKVDHVSARRRLETMPDYQAWVVLARTAQDLMWDYVGACVDRQIDTLVEKARVTSPRGSLRLDPTLEVPRYLSAIDTHRMPGSYFAEYRPDDVRQGAVFERAAVTYHRGRNGSQMNDLRGHTVMAHLFEVYPDVAPDAVLEIGCTIGNSICAVAGYLPDSEIHGIDIGAPVLRYAHARAEALGQTVHFSQQNGEATDFPDASFDLIYSCAMLHETSHRAVRNITRETWRLLKPGGVVIHLEVPARYEDITLWRQVRADFEVMHNSEPFWRGACKTDFAAVHAEAGFTDIHCGYQKTAHKAARGAAPGFSRGAGPAYVCWYIASARKPKVAE